MTAVTRQARTNAGDWFPSLDAARVHTQVRSSWHRQRCVLHEVLLDDGSRQERVVVKVRRDSGPAAGAAPGNARPVLAAAAPESVRDMARHEFEGLSLIARAVKADDPRFEAVRPLALLPDHAAFVMDHVDAPTMRSVLMTSSRLDPRRRYGAPRYEATFTRAGALLRAYHSQVADHPLPSRQESRRELVEIVATYVSHLGARTGDEAFFDRLAPIATQVIAGGLPERLPLVIGHGDFVVRNLFVAAGGRVRLIDPMPRWRVPPYEDLARFVVGFRLLGLQVSTAGAAFGQEFLDRLEDSFLQGYFGRDPIPAQTVKAYELVVLLDKWAAAAGRAPSRRWRRALDGAERWNAHRYFRGQTERLVRAGLARKGRKDP